MDNFKDIASSITQDEKDLFDILLRVQIDKAPRTNLRVAGGWVRDKLISRSTKDIDIMVDNMSGQAFCKLVTDALGSNDGYVIRENPEKTKHIETTKAFIPLPSGGVQEVDFAQARKDVYILGSRVPQVAPTTPEEDAFRRDLTVNSMFYNLHTGMVEDFTGMGKEDLKNMVLRTPKDPLRTFEEDWLRMFRVIRFASTLGWNMDQRLWEALKNPDLHKNFAGVARERMADEIEKMLKGPNPKMAFQLLKESGILDFITIDSLKGTKYEDKIFPFDMDQRNSHHKLSLWNHTMRVVDEISKFYKEDIDEKRVVVNLAALMHDFGKLYSEIQINKDGRVSYPGHEDVSTDIAGYIMKYLKLDKYTEDVQKLVSNHMRPHHLLNEGAKTKALRKFVRTLGEQSVEWLDVFNIAFADANAKDYVLNQETVQKYDMFFADLLEVVESLGTLDKTVSKVTPILDGYEIMTVLDIPPGIWMSKIKQFVDSLKDDNPNISKEDAAKKLKEWYEASGTNLEVSIKRKR